MSSVVRFPRTATTPPAKARGLFRLIAFLRRKLGTSGSLPSGRHRIPDDLLKDVLSDNGLRAREENRRRTVASGPWS